MIQYSIDRFEDDCAVLIADNGSTVTVKRSELHDGAREGDVVVFDGEKYLFEREETTKKRNEIASLIDELFV